MLLQRPPGAAGRPGSHPVVFARTSTLKIRCAFRGRQSVALGSLRPFEDDDGDLAGGPLLVFGEDGVSLLLAGPDGLPLVGLGDARIDLEGLGAHLDGGPRMGDEVVVPVRARGGPAVGGEDGGAVADRLVDHGVDALLARPGPDGVEQQHGAALVSAAHLAAVSAELLDHLLVVILASHLSSWSRLEAIPNTDRADDAHRRRLTE